MPDPENTPPENTPEPTPPVEGTTPQGNQENAQPGAPADVSKYTSLPSNVAAGLAAIFSVLGGIIFWVLEKEDKFVRFHAMQAIYLGAAAFILNIVGMTVGAIPILGWIIAAILIPIAMLVFLIFWLMQIFKAFNGQEWEVPYLGQMARKHLV